ncbi:MAG: hypothetical protein NWR54_13430, partial [Paracoccaceae bacterium]|nr:hypothetical protein [Paracoccaceae bacterium]
MMTRTSKNQTAEKITPSRKMIASAVRENAVCAVPEKMLHDSLFMTNRRALLADLLPSDALPSGWTQGKPHLTGACHDQM